MNTSKAISPVVATALLLVVAVIAVVGFQGWFATFQSAIQSDTETQSNAVNLITVEAISVDTTTFVYYGSKSETQINLTEIKLRAMNGTTMCTNTSPTHISPYAVNNTNMGDCSLVYGDMYEVIIVTNQGIYSESDFYK